MIEDYLIINNKIAAYRIVDGEAIVVNLKNSNFHSLNSVSTFIWQNLDGETTVNDIITHVCREFDVEFETAKVDCLEFIDDLLREDLVIKSANQLEKD